ncbi:MAG: DUF948 domain-containing protein [Actinomycetota bacterium]|nr:DUF948 domain-containing protein [Actinomycetota bacterium]MDQ3575082.1 DUF948 domain-containing protein [Actinomycetota bacterium]
MTAGEVAAIIAAVAGAILVVGMLFALASFTSTLRTMRTTVEELRRETVPLVADLRATLEQANAELARVDGLLGTAESVGTTVDSASRLAYLALSNPVIKAMAFGAGARGAFHRMRRRRSRT